MKQIFEVIRRPLVTEKSTALKDAHRQVVVETAVWANKQQIKQAAQSLFGIEVEQVRTSLMRGKIKRMGVSLGKRNNWKKAIITLKEGSDLDVFGVAPSAAMPQEQDS